MKPFEEFAKHCVPFKVEEEALTARFTSFTGAEYALRPLTFASIEAVDSQHYERIATIARDPAIAANFFYNDDVIDGRCIRERFEKYADYWKFSVLSAVGMIVDISENIVGIVRLSAFMEGAEISFWISSEHRGVMRLVVTHCLSILQEYPFVIAKIDSTNTRSQKLVTCCGFVIETGVKPEHEWATWEYNR